MQAVWIYTTFSNDKEAENFCETVIKKKYAYCVNITAKIKSIYPWKGKIQRCEEIGCYFKTFQSKKQLLIEYINKHHNYDIPCIFVINSDICNENYKKWAYDYLHKAPEL